MLPQRKVTKECGMIVPKFTQQTPSARNSASGWLFLPSQAGCWVPTIPSHLFCHGQTPWTGFGLLFLVFHYCGGITVPQPNGSMVITWYCGLRLTAVQTTLILSFESCASALSSVKWTHFRVRRVIVSLKLLCLTTKLSAEIRRKVGASANLPSFSCLKHRRAKIGSPLQVMREREGRGERVGGPTVPFTHLPSPLSCSPWGSFHHT